MGTYTDLTVAGYPIIQSKSTVVPEAMTIFRETDRRVFTRRVSARNALVWGEPENPNDEETGIAIEYSCETGKVIDRLSGVVSGVLGCPAADGGVPPNQTLSEESGFGHCTRIGNEQPSIDVTTRL
jgi:hypothetical protein